MKTYIQRWAIDGNAILPIPLAYQIVPQRISVERMLCVRFR